MEDERTHEFKVGIGLLSAPQFKGLGEMLSSESTPGGSITTESTYSAVLHLSYNYYIQPKWDIGFSFIYEQQTHTQEAVALGLLRSSVKYSDAYYSLLVSTHYHWVQAGLIDLYSGGGLGYSMTNREVKEKSGLIPLAEGSKGGQLAYQITPFGMRIGRTFNGFFELGYGNKGLLVLGVALRL
jgi:hypothetical protein